MPEHLTVTSMTEHFPADSCDKSTVADVGTLGTGDCKTTAIRPPFSVVFAD